MKTIRSMLILLGALGAAAPAPAQIVPLQEWCVTNSVELQNALTLAASNDKADVIKIAAGHYPAPAGGFIYNATFDGADEYFLSLEGGWTEFFGNPCGQLVTENPFATVLDGGGSTRIMRIRNHENSSVTVRLLTFINGNSPGHGGGLEVFPAVPAAFDGHITIERNMFLGNKTASSGSGLMASMTATGTDSRLRVVNNVFVANRAGLTASVYLRVDEGDAGAGIIVTNNTVINNTVVNNSPDDNPVTFSGGIWLVGTVTTRLVSNNNLWGNDVADMRVVSSGNLTLRSNNIGRRIGHPPTSEGGNISVAPQYEPCFLCFEWVPVLNSPLVDAGMHPGLASNWALTGFDLRGRLRVSGGTVDIGAYENHDRFFSDRFEQ